MRSPDALAHALRAPGQLGLGRAYVSGRRSRSTISTRCSSCSTAGSRRRSTAAPRRGWRSPRSAPPASCGRPPCRRSELRPRGRRHSPERDARSVRHHYDVSNDFFRLMLGESMTYSCALFSRGATTLDEAQEAKLELVCTKLALSSGQRVLDVGCGWGSFALHAAANHGVHVTGITLSEPQAALARQARRGARARRSSGHPCDGLPRPRGEPFDAVASIGMVEHVGSSPDRRVRAPGRAAREARRTRAEPRHRPAAGGRPRGRTVLGALRVPRRRTAPPVAHPAGARARRARDRARGGTPLRLRGDARHWAANIDDNLDEATRLAGPERIRVWRLYLRAARRGFESGFTSIYQVRGSRPG